MDARTPTSDETRELTNLRKFSHKRKEVQLINHAKKKGLAHAIWRD